MACDEPRNSASIDAGHARSKIVGLNAGQNQIRAAVFFDGLGQGLRGGEFIGAFEFFVEQMNRAIGSHRQAGPQDASRLFATHRNDDDFAAVLLLQAQRFFQRVVVGFTGDKSQVLILIQVFVSLMTSRDAGSGTGLMQLMIFTSKLPRMSGCERESRADLSSLKPAGRRSAALKKR